MPDSADNKILLGIVRRLDALIAILLDKPNADSSVTATEKIKKLMEVGLSPSDIAVILGKPTNQVTALMSALKKKPHKNTKSNG